MDYDDLVGTPFKYGGRGRDALDCWGVVIEIYRRLGIGIEDVAAYDAVLATETNPVFDTARTSAWHAVAPPFQPYDVLLFAAGCCGKAATHCAVWLGDGRMLHAIDKAGVTVARWRHFARKFITAYRHEALECRA